MKLKFLSETSKKNLIVGIISLFAAILLEFMTLYQSNVSQSIFYSSAESRKLTLSEFQSNQCKKEKNKLISEGLDPYIYFDGIQEYVGFLEIDLEKAVEAQWYCQVYYSRKNSEEFCENQSKGLWIAGNQKKILVDLNQNIQNLRIDFGSEINQEFIISKIVLNPDIAQYIAYIISRMSIIRINIYFLVIFMVGIYSIEKTKFLKFVYRYRWLLGCIIIIICTFLKLHGSSVGVFCSYGLPGVDSSNLWGIPRGIRSDEYVVFTEMALSQTKEGFPWF